MTKPEHLEPPELLTRSSSGKLPYATQESLHWVAANMWRYRGRRRTKKTGPSAPTAKDD
jgi:hypothetical protein